MEINNFFSDDFGGPISVYLVISATSKKLQKMVGNYIGLTNKVSSFLFVSLAG